MRCALTVFLYTVNAPFAYVVFALIACLPTRDALGRARRIQAFQAFAYRRMHDWLRGFGITRFDHRRALRDLPAGPAVVVANHPTLMDITSITACLGGGFTIVKPELWRRRMLHPLLRSAGHIEGPGEDPFSAGRVVRDAIERLERGHSLIVFPEGTRTRPDERRPFGRIAFEIACRACVPLVSIGVRCEPPYLTKERTVLDPPHPCPVLELELLAVDDPADVGHDSRALLQRVEQRFRAWAGGDLAAPTVEGVDSAIRETSTHG